MGLLEVELGARGTTEGWSGTCKVFFFFFFSFLARSFLKTYLATLGLS